MPFVYEDWTPAIQPPLVGNRGLVIYLILENAHDVEKSEDLWLGPQSVTIRVNFVRSR